MTRQYKELLGCWALYSQNFNVGSALKHQSLKIFIRILLFLVYFYIISFTYTSDYTFGLGHF